LRAGADIRFMHAEQLPKGPFGTVLADPPWPTRQGNSGSKWMSGMAHRSYPTMRMSDIIQLPVNQVAAPDAVLLLWCTWGNVANAVEVMSGWGFTYATGMPWLKTMAMCPSDVKGLDENWRHMMKPIYGPGVWFQHCTELLLVGRRGQPFGSMGNPRPARKGIIISPRLEHSRKPEEVQLWVESSGFPRPWLELFARRPREGWTVWGDEV